MMKSIRSVSEANIQPKVESIRTEGNQMTTYKQVEIRGVTKGCLERCRCQLWEKDPLFTPVYEYLHKENEAEIFRDKLEELRMFISDMEIRAQLKGIL